MATPFRVLVECGQRLAATQRRGEIQRLLARLLTTVAHDEIEQTARLIIGRPLPAGNNHALQMSGSSIWRAMEPIFGQSKAELLPYVEGAVDLGAGVREIFLQVPKQPQECADFQEELTIPDVYGALVQIASISGSGSQTEKEIVLRELLCRATPNEAMYLVKNVIGEMRHGVSQGLMLDGIARAAKADPALVRRSFMFIGDIGTLARIAVTEGVAALEALEISLFTPLRPMLAQSVDDVSGAWVKHGGHLALEYKLDGARVQIHRVGNDVRIFTRHLMEITASLPEIVEAVRTQITADNAILEGEVVAIDPKGRALPFQELMRRFRRVHDVPRLLQEVPVKLYLFDLLLLNNEPLIELDNTERWARLQQITHVGGVIGLVPRLTPGTVEEGAKFFEQAIDQGHEGLVAKRLDSRYTPGVRGAGWLKIKEALTVDLVITAAEWGYGRRAGWLSNYHLAALDIVTGELVMVGKTFKGLTDLEFAEMTRALLERRAGPHGLVIQVRPEIVVEVAFNQIQRSSVYPGGISLRFARIVRFRPSKGVEDIDTLQTLRDLYRMETSFPQAEAA